MYFIYILFEILGDEFGDILLNSSSYDSIFKHLYMTSCDTSQLFVVPSSYKAYLI